MTTSARALTTGRQPKRGGTPPTTDD